MKPILLFISLFLFTAEAAFAKKNDFAKVNAQFAEMEEKIRQLNGEIERLNHRINSLSQNLDKALKDIEYRFQQQAENAPAYNRDIQFYEKDQPVNLTPPATPVETPEEEKQEPVEKTSMKKLTEEYEKGIAYMRAAHYEQAEDVLYNFIQAHPDNELTGNAYYWLGEAFFVRDLFEQAAVYFLKGYQNFPKGEKSPDSLLRLAMTFNSLKKTQESCASFDKLFKEFPKMPKDIKEQAIIEKARVKC